jgi:pentatricopeptide repeat protein
MHGVIMDVYIQAGRIDDAEAIFRQLHQPDVTKFTVLVHGYGIHDQPGKAMNLLLKVLENDDQLVSEGFGRFIHSPYQTIDSAVWQAQRTLVPNHCLHLSTN